MPTIVPVILAGGLGKRLQPLSTSNRPKQFLPFSKEGKTPFQWAAKRALTCASALHCVTVTSAQTALIAHQQLQSIDPGLTRHVILEPMAKNTAAAATLAAIYATQHLKDPILLLLPSDHLINPADAIARALPKMIKEAKKDRIVTFGIPPKAPNSQLGYLIADPSSTNDIMPIRHFFEKPAGDRLQWCMRQPNVFYNSGMFLMKASVLLQAMRLHHPETLAHCVTALAKGRPSRQGHLAHPSSMEPMESLSLDRAIMEKSSHLLDVMPLDVTWSDLGSWQSVWELSQAEGTGAPLEKFLDALARVA